MSVTNEPEWIAVLRAYCEKHSQPKASKLIGYAPGTISAVIAGKYPADMGRIQQAVEGALMAASVDCPVAGEIPRQTCIAHQRRAHNPQATNPMRVALSRACPDCPKSGGA